MPATRATGSPSCRTRCCAMRASSSGLKMHTQGMTLEQARDFFARDGYQPKALTVSESKRGTTDALYGYYTMGKLAIQKLREDYRRQQGAAFRLQEFHDRFIALGPLPLPAGARSDARRARAVVQRNSFISFALKSL